MSFAYKTPVGSPKGPRPIEDYAVGDAVLAASEAGTGWAWATDAVGFSSGTGPGTQSTLVIIRFGVDSELIVTPDQPMLIAGGKLQTAARLVVGRDSLVAAADGSALPIQSIMLGEVAGGVQAIATGIGGGLAWDGSLDGHLLNCAGAICGDFVLQIRHGDPRMARYLAPDAPAIGTPDYDAQRSTRIGPGPGREWAGD